MDDLKSSNQNSTDKEIYLNRRHKVQGLILQEQGSRFQDQSQSFEVQALIQARRGFSSAMGTRSGPLEVVARIQWTAKNSYIPQTDQIRGERSR